LTITSPDGRSWVLTTAASTIGEAFDEEGLVLSSSDRLEPAADTPILGDLTVTWNPAVDLTISADGNSIQVRSAAETVGDALVESSLPLIGLDYSIPSETEPLPPDGLVRIVRVTEDVSLTSKSLPYGTRTELSADLEIDQQGLIQGGEAGLAVARMRTRLEDGSQVSQVVESESIIKPPQDQLLGIGTKIVIRTTVVDGVSIEYWRALNLFATYYVPCGPSQERCYYGTASGTLVRKGAVAMVYPWYLLFAGERLYIPGYGFGTVEDNNGALVNALGGTYWVDLGYSMEDVVDWTNRYVTVYFLTPVPANVADTYLLP
jgi:3D (Asp-Asp-Asp) domain-containing protein